MPSFTDLQPRVLLRRTPQASSFDLVLRWAPEQLGWLPRPNDEFHLLITIHYTDGRVAYVDKDGMLVETEPTGPDVPVARPMTGFMLDPPRESQPIPGTTIAPDDDPVPAEIKHWLQGKRPELPVDCSIATDPFPSDHHGFGVCHLLAEAQPSRAAWRIHREAVPMVARSIERYLGGRAGAFWIAQRSGAPDGRSDRR